jgi:aspartate kinase
MALSFNHRFRKLSPDRNPLSLRLAKEPRNLLIVQKFGGTSIASVRRIQRVADIVEQTRRAGNRVVVVVSAMGNQTDRLLRLARSVTPNPHKRELDMLLTSGERQSTALLSMALRSRGLDSVSFTGSQVGIITDDNHADARIAEIRGERLRDALRRNRIPIVAGFQGVSPEREITTLGRGGSDTTAVALAAYLGAHECEIYTDVPGVFSEDPRQFKGVRRLPEISYQEMLELANGGAQVLHPRACALAAKYHVPIRVLSSFAAGEGTVIKEEFKVQRPITGFGLQPQTARIGPGRESRKSAKSTVRQSAKNRAQNRRKPGGGSLEKAFVRAITHSGELCRLSLIKVPRVPKCLAQGVTQLAKEHVPLVFFAHGIPTDDRFDLSYIVSRAEYARTRRIIEQIGSRVKAERLDVQCDLGSVSVVGPGVGSDAEIIADLFTIVSRLGIHVDAFSTAETKITVFLHRPDLKRTVVALLDHFGLRK